MRPVGGGRRVGVLVWSCSRFCSRGWFSARFEGEGFALGSVSEDEATSKGVWSDGNVCATVWTVDVKDEVMCQRGREDEGRAFDGEDYRRFEQAGDFFGVGRTERRGDGGLDGGQADDDDRLGIVEGGRGVEAEVKGVAVGEGDGGDVLIFGGVEAAGDANEVHDGADVGAIVSPACKPGVACLVDEVGVGSVVQCVGDRLTMTVVEEGLVAGLGEAGGLRVDWSLEAVAVGLEVEGAGEEVGVFG